ncbi:TraR/DksA C4-type zinc finger protein [Desulfocurvibacter africanus]|uniref:Transcriptional regulator, TraR/DksA family n=1 Tax=Desulfocurvibacter africanus subsp. africanus str. Walvis Bay TaxID=690850 RepID=F3Z2R2_DESAF|nr:TraR/DksA C4-type zinc finger protein [Desulfocurvibacter africanus]EGJ50229.1 transcriptional regulator, TraR/DksA family [Desulfocurvibacter africanus subsp. africanus str. Walvis Bay]
MDPRQREDIRRRIVELIETLRSDMAMLEENAKPVDLDQPIGRLSRMDSMASQALGARSLAEAKVRLVRLEQALRQVDSPEFGFCASCGEEIAIRRILAMPETDLCVHCAQ